MGLTDDVITNLKNLRKEIASIPELQNSERDIDEIIENIKSPLLIMVMGEFSTGKSTFINALVGQSIAKVDAKPTTAVITKLSYGVEDRITVHFRDDSIQNYDTDSFAQLTAEGDDAANELHDGIAYVERELPIDILKSMSIIDSPGLNSIKAVHEETTRRFMGKADTVLWLFDANKPGSQTEIDALKRLNPRLEPICIVNKIDAVDEDDGDSPEKIMEDIGRKLSNNKLEYQKIIGISAKMAFQGKQKNNEKLIAESNIDEFYDTVDTIVLPNRDRYKRNSMFDGLAQVVFRTGSIVTRKQKSNDCLKDSDYATYIENKRRLASVYDNLELLANIFTENQSLTQYELSRLPLAEKTFFAVLYWFGLKLQQDTKIAQQYLEEAAIRNDRVAQTILAEVCFCAGEKNKALYWLGELLSYDNEHVLYGTETMYLVALAYKNGDGIKQDIETAIDWFKKAADAGNLTSMCALGRLYADGDGVQQDYTEALKWHCKAADMGNSSAMYEVGKFYQNGWGVPWDYGKALQWFHKAADIGHIESMLFIGKLYQDGIGVTKNVEAAIGWYNKAADAGSVDAMFTMGNIYDKGELVSRNHQRAMEWYQKAADAGHNDAQMLVKKRNNVAKENAKEAAYNKGQLYENEKNYTEAMKWYRKADDVYNGRAMISIGMFYLNGQGVSKDIGEAVKWFKKSADIGHWFAMLLMGAHLEHGDGVPQDYTEAMRWYRKSADNGCGLAMLNIGRLYLHGSGVPQSYDEAIEWYRKAIETDRTDSISNDNKAEAMYTIGFEYYEGKHIPQDYEEARIWFLKAADAGHAVAMAFVGQMYELGRGVPKDETIAVNWYQRAASAGFKPAAETLEMLKKKQNKSSCFITTAVCASLGRPDDCYELRMFRNFRDTWLIKQDDGPSLISEYYRIAPVIVQAINLHANANDIYQEIWSKYLQPCLRHLELGENHVCKKQYIAMVKDLKAIFM